MAQFNADILLSVKGAKKIEAEINKIDQKLKKLDGKGILGDKQTRVERKLLESQKRRLQVQGAIEKKNRNITVGLQKQATLTKQIAANEKQAAAAATKRAAATKKAANDAKRQAIGKRGVGALTGGAISAAFPLLTGGSGIESALGAVGGAAGGLFGGLGGFAGGIAGSAIGRLITDAENLDRALAKLNGVISDVGGTSDITASQIAELASQLGIAKEEAVDAVAAFSNLKPEEALEATRAFADVGGASTLEALATAGIDRESALQSIVALEKVIGSELAEQLISDLKINDAAIVQAALIDAVADKQDTVNDKTRKAVGFWENIKSLVFEVGAALGGYDVTDVPSALDLSIEGGPKDANKDIVDNIINNIERLRAATRNTQDGFKPPKKQKALPQSKELQLRQQILKTELAVANIRGKRAALQLTDLEAVRAKEQLLAASLVKETQILELARQQALINSKVPEDNALINELYDDRLKKIQAQNFLLREQNGLAEKNILLQRDLVALRNEQQTRGIVQGLERGIEDANSRSSSEMLSLRIKQLRRQEDLIGAINDKLAEQRKIEAGGDAKQAEAATREIGVLEDRKAAIEALLPALNQAEQQQLRFNQAFAAITPAVNSLVGGLREVVAGTKTAEEAFADFLNTIADQLINTAATMIAQYIALGIARMFAFGGNSAAAGAEGIGAAAAGGFSLPGLATGGTANGGLATGGTANGGQPYIVGEKGPELFLPGVTGTVVNNDQFEAARASMSYYGGSSGGANGGSGTFRLETTVINGVEYATVDQVRAMGESSARQGAAAGNAMTMNSLRNSRSQRSKIGMGR